MKKKQKRFLQMTFVFMVALVFLPNIGLWSLYKDKQLVKSVEPGEQDGCTHCILLMTSHIL